MYKGFRGFGMEENIRIKKEFILFLYGKVLIIMCEYAEIEKIKLSNGKTIKEVNEDVRKEVERIYLEGWAKGIAIPFWDKEGNYYLATPDGSEDLVSYDVNTRSYQIISRTADKGKGRYAYLLNK